MPASKLCSLARARLTTGAASITCVPAHLDFVMGGSAQRLVCYQDSDEMQLCYLLVFAFVFSLVPGPGHKMLCLAVQLSACVFPHLSPHLSVHRNWSLKRLCSAARFLLRLFFLLHGAWSPGSGHEPLCSAVRSSSHWLVLCCGLRPGVLGDRVGVLPQAEVGRSAGLRRMDT